MAMVEPKVVVPLGRGAERRGAERFDMDVPLTVRGGPGGATRNLSVSGIAFTSRQPYAPGERIELVLEYLLDGDSYPLRCQAVVVRCDACAGGFTIGARLATAFIE